MGKKNTIRLKSQIGLQLWALDSIRENKRFSHGQSQLL